jgi:hypothetical protein
MSRERDDIEKAAIRYIQEADMWWRAFRDSVMKWHQMKLYEIAHARHLDRSLKLGNRLGNSRIQMRLREESDYGHDMCLMIHEDIVCMARSAVSCEMAHQIYIDRKMKAFEEENNDEDRY